jgi:predicted ferric reductase
MDMTVALIAALNPKLSWYAARASGLIAWALVTLSILWGLALSTRLVRRRGIPAWLLDLHKFLGTLSLVFVGVHIVALWADNFVAFGPRELFVPFASSWRTGAVAWGIAATYLLVAVQLTSWAMRRLPRRLWHSVHLMSIPMFVTATLHGFTSGADGANVAVQWPAVTGGVFVFLLVSLRVLAPRRRPRPVASRPAEVPRGAEPSAAMFRGRSADPPAADIPTVDPTVDTPTVDTAAKVAALARIVESIAGGGRPT